MVYLIHFSKKFYHARHYIGWTQNLSQRMSYHRNGNGAKILNALNKLGIEYTVVREWEDGTPELEKQLKRQKNSKRFCPICSGGKE